MLVDNKRYYDCDNGSKIMESSSTIGSFANSTICPSVTNNAFSIERSRNGLFSRKFVRILFLWLLIISSCLGEYESTEAQYVRFGSIATVSLIDNER